MKVLRGGKVVAEVDKDRVEHHGGVAVLEELHHVWTVATAATAHLLDTPKHPQSLLHRFELGSRTRPHDLAQLLYPLVSTQ